MIYLCISKIGYQRYKDDAQMILIY